MPPKAKSAAKIKPPPANYDTPWKIALERHFQKFMAFYFPSACAQIDWQIKHEFLDKELQKITKTALVGTRHVDKLVKVTRLSGQEDWICIHVEVQVSREPKFAERMFVYNYRIFDRYTRPVVSMAVLGDNDPDWLPQQFGYAAMDCEMAFRFPIAKLAQFIGQEAALESHANPFALLTLAYLQNRATSKDMQARYEVKCKLIRLLLERKWDGALIREFFLVIDWMMELPPELALQLSQFVTDLEEEQKMEYVSSIERIKLEQKRQEGRQEGTQEGESVMLCRLLTRRFGELPQWAQERIKNASRPEIESWFDRGFDAGTLMDVFEGLGH
jgi:Domain of unknown function (DUF4351)